ncbi:hypothetical protein D9615_004498 [Tricholomella constricta]|uniref:Uncharacterized protein n=1 Tax=Tricholomella constricta TaxID=117010 RepID=A0A8H5HBW4_9AGAR|nr:hypothetical protein D9615_004498 [Tricholomella constricta]
MSDYDDYFTDDIFFDDQTLAILDHEEQKYLTQAVKAPPPPPTKRQKTENGWTAGVGTFKAPVTVSDHLPEICLSLDGFYGVQRNASQLPTPAIPPHGPSTKNNSYAGTYTNQPLAPASRPPPTAVQRVPLPLKSRTASASSFQHQSHSRPPSGSQSRPLGFQRPNSRGNTSQAVPNSRNVSIPPPRSPSPSIHVPNHVNQSHELEKQLRELQQRLEQVSEENKKIQVALKEALHVRMAKEGEVTVLRKNAEKVSQEHAAQLAKLKLAREEAEAKQTRMQKEMREQVERLKTQFTFKQHEQESARKPPPSARPGKIYKEPHSRNMSTPSQPRWSVHQDAASGSRDNIEETQTSRPSVGNIREVCTSPQAKRTSMLPGFQNTFNDSTPLRPSRMRHEKGMQVASANTLAYEPPLQHRYTDPFSPAIQQRRSPSADDDVRMEGSMGETNSEAVPDADGDIEMPLGTADDDGGVVEENTDMSEDVYSIEAPNWKEELNRIVLMHCLPTCTTLTLQMLLGASVTPELGEGLSETYLASCTSTLKVIANASKHDDWRYSIECLSRSLISMIPALRTANSFLPLAALLNLLAVLIYSLPNFRSFILSEPFDTQTSDSRILVFLCGIILDLREIEKHPSHEVLATEVVTLLESISLMVEAEFVDKLAYLSRNRHILMNLFRANQPSWLLARSARLLVVLASHRKLCRFLLSMPDPDLPAEEGVAESQKNHIVERLCLYLMDAGRKDAEYKDAKTSILTLFTLLSTSHSEIHAHMVASTTVIPSLVLFLTQLTTAFWEDDEDLLTAPSEEISLAIRTLNQTLFLLHHLVFTTVPVLNLRQKLHSPYHRLFHGLLHMFIVTFGRLSYGEAPEWIDRQGRIDLVSSTDMARDILDHVVDGPEADRTWQAYQLEGERSSDTDEEEMEEKLLGDRI